MATSPLRVAGAIASTAAVAVAVIAYLAADVPPHRYLDPVSHPGSWVEFGARQVLGRSLMRLGASILPREHRVRVAACARVPTGGRTRSLLGSHAQVFDHLFRFGEPMMMYSATRLGVFDALGDNSMTSAALAKATGLDALPDDGGGGAGGASRLERLLHPLANLGYVQFDAGTGRWANTAMSSLLRQDHPTSLCVVARRCSKRHGQ